MTKEHLVSLLNNQEIDIKELFTYYLNNGGTNLDLDTFYQCISIYISKVGLEGVYKKMIIEFGVNKLFDSKETLLKYY